MRESSRLCLETVVQILTFKIHSNECNTIIISACIPTLRPLFLIVFKRPGYAIYVRSKRYEPTGAGGRRTPGSGRGRVVPAPSSDSTTAIGDAAAGGDETWLEAGDDEAGKVVAAKGGIRRTIELDVVSRMKRNSPDYDQFSREAVGEYAV